MSGNTRQTVLLGLFTAMALVVFVVDLRFTIVPAFPGFKLGLANTVTLVALEFFNSKAILMLVAARTVLGSLFSGTFLGPALAMSLSAGLISTCGMLYGYHRLRPKLSIIGISVLGAALHNFTQLTVAAYLLGSTGLYDYLPLLTVLGIISGTTTGCLAYYAGSKLTLSPGEYQVKA